jgi:DNA mismatch endonuclease (patch repair protein)
MDTVDQKTRSRIMASVKSSGNRSTEKRLRSALIRAKIRGWRIQVRELPGTPDFVFEKEHLIIFVDGCFWHGCPYCYRRPNTSRKYWDDKVQRNISRDKKVKAKLRREGWSVIRVWEHELSNLPQVIHRILRKLDK